MGWPGTQAELATTLYGWMLSIIHFRSKQACGVRERCVSYDTPVAINTDLNSSVER